MASPGFVVVAEGIRGAARQASLAGEGVQGLALGAVATKISGALRATRSASAAGELSTAWDAVISSWSTDVAAHAQRLNDSATTYQTSDTDAEDRFDRTGPVS